MASSKKDTTESRINKISGGEEPSFVGTEALKEMDLCRHLNWYNQHRDTIHAQKYLQTFCTSHDITFTEAQIKSRPNTLGFVCRMLSRGAILSPEASTWLQESIRKMEQVPVSLPSLPAIHGSDRPKPQKVKTSTKLSSNVLVSACIADLDAAVDEFILSDCKKGPSPLAILEKYALAKEQIPEVINRFKKMRDEYREVLLGEDAVLVEGYSNYTTAELKKLEAYTDSIMSDALKTIGIQQKAPRKKKIKTPDQLVKKLKYQQTPQLYGKLAIASLDPKTIIGAASLFVFNTKTRLLGCYIAETDEGLSLKGSTLLNFSTSRSLGKTIRKPEEQLQALLTGGKVTARHFLDSIHAKPKTLNGRINKECIILKSLH
jgi:hypothetical protein